MSERIISNLGEMEHGVLYVKTNEHDPEMVELWCAFSWGKDGPQPSLMGTMHSDGVPLALRNDPSDHVTDAVQHILSKGHLVPLGINVHPQDILRESERLATTDHETKEQ